MWLLLEWPIARIFTTEKKTAPLLVEGPALSLGGKPQPFFWGKENPWVPLWMFLHSSPTAFLLTLNPSWKLFFFCCSAPSPADCKQRSNIKTAGFRAQLLAWGTGSRCEDMCSNILIYTVCDYSSESNWLERPHRSLCSKSHEKFSHLCFCMGFSLLIDLLCSSAAQAYQMFVT